MVIFPLWFPSHPLAVYFASPYPSFPPTMPSLNALPPLGDLFLEDKAARKAYLRLLENQEELPTMILGQMLIQAPVATARTHVADLINRCPTNQYSYCLLLTFVPSKRSVFSSYSTHTINVTLGLAPGFVAPGPDQPRRGQEAVDSNAIRFIPGLHAETIQTKAAARNTGCTHIVSQYGEHASNCQETTVWELTRLLGGILNDELDAEGARNLGNVLTLEHGIRMCFNAFQIWLEPTGVRNNGILLHQKSHMAALYLVQEVENQYFIRGLEEPDCTGLPERVTFSSRFPNLGLPNPQYLKIHALLARIIKFSGAAGYIARTIGEAERTGVLSEDGSSARLLYSLLSAEALVAF
ncbi:hypothetical protein RHS01_10161 [Rhizoctonia solani]|uniref:HNH nuclease domain-containing protein n=1 Tax=Rhizoctonia solani TaxID=456999 RepID=A0A8H7M0B7_9AGAM|nr:hypothetical protein RHS01_10161 [Rhizoctonia solani]